MSTYQVRSLEEADQIIKEHERKSKTYYSLLRSTKNFGCIDVPACSNDENEVRFETVGVPYCGVPFFVAGLKILQCQSYRNRGGRKKKEIKIEITGSGSGVIGDAGVRDAGGDDDADHLSLSPPPPQRPSIKKKKKFGRMNKVGCTATIIMKEVIYYPEFQLFDHSKNGKVAVARQLKEALKAKTQVQKDRIIYVTVPAMSDHFGHSVLGIGTTKTNPTNRHKTTLTNVSQSASKRLYVKNDFYGHNEPGSSKRVYYPVKQEKSVPFVSAKKVKIDVDIDHDFTEERAREVRELLQSIMGLTYKSPGTPEAYDDLYKGLLHCKLKYQQMMDITSVSSEANASSTVVPHAVSGANNSHWTRKITGNHVNSSNSSTIIAASSNNFVNNSTSLPIGTSSLDTNTSSPVTTVVFQPNVSSTVSATTTNGSEGTNQETSIFIEAVEAILNSQV